MSRERKMVTNEKELQDCGRIHDIGSITRGQIGHFRNHGSLTTWIGKKYPHHDASLVGCEQPM